MSKRWDDARDAAMREWNNRRYRHGPDAEGHAAFCRRQAGLSAGQEAGRRDGRHEGMVEAATIADRANPDEQLTSFDLGRTTAAGTIAAAIRAALPVSASPSAPRGASVEISQPEER